MFKFSITVFFLTASTLSVVANVSTGLWKSTALNVSTITAGEHVELTTSSEFLCATRALLEASSSLYCFNGGRCILSLGSGKLAPGGAQPGPWTCKCGVPACPVGFEAIGCFGCYFFSKTSRTVEVARTECQNKGASTASMTDLTEFQTVARYLMQKKSTAIFSADLVRVDATNFIWGDGTVLPSPVRGVKPWAVNEPDNFAEKCTSMPPYRNYSLCDVMCGSRNYICRV